MSVDVVGGQTRTILRSGSDVRVTSGQARISLVESGQISICGPAHFSVLKAGGALTLALDSGVIHARMDREPGFVVYTAQIQARSMAIGDEPRELLVGFESAGMMCVKPFRGAIRLEQQLTGQSVVVPQGGDVLLSNGQIDGLRIGDGHCSCELEMAKALTPTAPRVSSAPAGTASPTTSVAENKESGGTAAGAAQDANDPPAANDKPAAKEEPVYQVVLPPLRYDAAAKVQPEPDPQLMVIVRKVRVRPTLIFRGQVEEPTRTAVASAAPARPPSPAGVQQKPTQAPAQQGSTLDHVRSFFRKLWTPGG
jgi:hypothetical protein